MELCQPKAIYLNIAYCLQTEYSNYILLKKIFKAIIILKIYRSSEVICITLKFYVGCSIEGLRYKETTNSSSRYCAVVIVVHVIPF